jgi:hypothetical protein
VTLKVMRLWAFLSVNPDDGEEGVIAMQARGIWHPFVASDEQRVASMRVELIKLMPELRVKNQSVQLARFDVRTDVEVIR